MCVNLCISVFLYFCISVFLHVFIVHVRCTHVPAMREGAGSSRKAEMSEIARLPELLPAGEGAYVPATNIIRCVV